MNEKIKILLCSPFYPNSSTTTCGVANWTRNVYMYYTQNMNEDFIVKLLPLDRSVDLGENSSFFERLVYGIKDYFSLYRQFKQELNKTHYDIIQVSTSASMGLVKDYLFCAYARKKGIKVVLHFHFGRIPFIHSVNNFEWKFLSQIMTLCHSVIAMDNASYEILEKANITKVFYLPNPLSSAIITQIQNQAPINRHNNSLLFVGHIVKGKGIYELVSACSKIKGIKLRLVGKCDDFVRQELINIVALKATDGNFIDFVGEVSHKRVIEEMMKCDIFILPSYSEGFPNVILESMACGCAIIASSVGAIPEMLTMGEEKCGVLINPQSENDIISSIKDLINDKDLKYRLGVNAKQKVYQSYNISSVWKQLLDIWVNITNH